MNEEFAVEPTTFENALQLKYILEKFGFYHGRFIVGFPSGWIKQVHEHFQSLSDNEQKRATQLLKNAKERNAVVKSGDLGYEPSLTWIDNVHTVSVGYNPFEGIIAAAPNSFGFPTVNEVYEMDDDFFGSSNDIRITGTAENYSRVAKRLLQMSNEVVLVDPYLRLEKLNREKVVKRFLDIAQQGKCRSFVLWIRYKEATKIIDTLKAYKGMLEKKYRPSLTPKSTLTVKLVNDEGSSEKMHARLLLSKDGGLRFDHGFEELDKNRQADVSLVSQQAHGAHCSWYLDRNSQNDFDIVDDPCISG